MHRILIGDRSKQCVFQFIVLVCLRGPSGCRSCKNLPPLGNHERGCASSCYQHLSAAVLARWTTLCACVFQRVRCGSEHFNPMAPAPESTREACPPTLEAVAAPEKDGRRHGGRGATVRAVCSRRCDLDSVGKPEFVGEMRSLIAKPTREKILALRRARPVLQGPPQHDRRDPLGLDCFLLGRAPRCQRRASWANESLRPRGLDAALVHALELQQELEMPAVLPEQVGAQTFLRLANQGIRRDARLRIDCGRRR